MKKGDIINYTRASGIVFHKGKMKEIGITVRTEHTPRCTTLSLGDDENTMIMIKMNDDTAYLLQEVLKEYEN